ncbi:CpsD/CapB family tyrosine-protein kinase [Tateyamaria sp. ANG-S1]|uniref:CpsD/CapB family tyrosine-protein kinase n=1 Tax=Tateyamaria sp. ANG-S1 TaxID=1577905 RepID=UPI00068A372D|nr:CpsD/CapB family tyrosine-protein kinase [Tateyamaria sp. ANG-S1]
MEKIQSAIAKARAERQHVSPTRPLFHHRDYDQDHSETAWAALPLIEPSMKRLRSQRIVTLDRVGEAAAFDKLRTRMLQQMHANNWRRVAITSPGPSSGKSTVSMNLAYSMSRQMKSRVILSELDLRKPSIMKSLRLKTDRDFSKVIQHTSPFADEAVRLKSNFALGVLQRPVEASAEILQNPQLEDTLQQIEADYDPTIMMFDLPPFQVSDDVMAFATKVDCVLIVAAAEQTKIDALDVCERELADVTNILGIVLNKCRYETEDASYNYYG